MKSESQIFLAIENACASLVYISETDAPVAPFEAEEVADINTEIIRKKFSVSNNTPVEEKGFDDLFERLTAIKDWHGKKEIAQAKKIPRAQNLARGKFT